jgi:hypothetical protein
MENLWYSTREYNERGNSLPLPSYVRIAFTNPEMTRRIREECDFAVRVTGRCVEALVVSKLTTNINSGNVPVSDDDSELACLSAILGSKTRDVMLLLEHPGAVEFTNMIFLALDNFFTLETVPLDVLNVVQGTFRILSLRLALPADQTNSTLMSDPDGQCEFAL